MPDASVTAPTPVSHSALTRRKFVAIGTSAARTARGKSAKTPDNRIHHDPVIISTAAKSYAMLGL